MAMDKRKKSIYAQHLNNGKTNVLSINFTVGYYTLVKLVTYRNAQARHRMDGDNKNSES